jgi:hypothetical protein
MGVGAGIITGISGKVGNVVFQQSRGQQIIKAYQPKVYNPNKLGQKQQRARIRGIVALSKNIGQIYDYTFKRTKPGRSKLSEFQSAALPSISAVNPDVIVFEHDTCVFARGSYEQLAGTAPATIATDTIECTWSNVVTGTGLQTDVVAAVVVNTERLSQSTLSEKVTRADEALQVTIGDDFDAGDYAVYLVTYSANGSNIADSQFVGLVAKS